MDDLRRMLEEHAGIPEEIFKKAVAIAEKNRSSILGALEATTEVDESVLLDIFAKYYQTPKVKLSEMDIPTSIIGIVPKSIAQEYRIVPIDRAGNNLVIATANPKNLAALDTIRFKVGYFPKPVLASELQIAQAIERYYGKLDFGPIDSSNQDVSFNTRAPVRQTIGVVGSGEKDDGTIVRLVNDVLIQCLSRKASDIHVESYEDSIRIRLRIDGNLVEIAQPPVNMKAALISRIKILSGMNIAESRLPQDGAINISIGDKPVDFRVNSLPTTHGEKIVMRILDKSNLHVDMTALGFEKAQLESFNRAIHSSFGMVLVTGPTGSGKTTTLYSALQELNREDCNILTAEDPVEYSLAGVNQSQMKPEIGLDFANALRAFLRQDPDIIMVGEIRDLETAEIAIKASLTGHLVLSTLHTNSAPDTISRLLNMGVANFNLVAALTCITAQRLMKMICKRCKQVDQTVTPEVLLDLGIPANYVKKVKAHVGRGCEACNGTGVKGRVAIHEVLIMSEPIKQAILEKSSSMQLKRTAMENGMKTLRQSALSKMAQGLVSAQEVVKVTASDENRSG